MSRNTLKIYLIKLFVMYAEIKAIEYIFPENKLSNNDLKILFPDYDFDKFEERVGIKTRYTASEKETAMDLAEKACHKLFSKHDKDKIDYILYCTQSPEYFLPTTACILQNKLGIRKNIGAFDFNLGCSGFTYGVSMANALITAGQAQNVLLVTADTYSKFIHPKDRSNRAIFGDAAAVTLISKAEENAIFKFRFGSDGAGYDKLIVRNGGSRFAFDANAPEIDYGSGNIYTNNHLYMDGPEVFNFTTRVIPDFVKEILADNNKSVEDIGQFIFHQANSYMLDFLRKRIKIDKSKFYNNLQNGGNTVSCTIPIALKEYSKITEEKSFLACIVGFGVGLSWSGGIVQINNKL